MDGIKLIYLMDPHCGWCFGYSKTITELYERRVSGGSIGFEMVPGGLFIPRIRGSSEFADDKRAIAARIEHLFDVAFSPHYFENVLAAPWIDSTPSSEAILACNVVAPSRTLHLSSAILDAAFVDGRDISLLAVVLEIVEEQGFDSSDLEGVMASKRVEDDLGSSLSFAADVNTGFPALFVQDTRRERLVHLGGSDLSAADLLQAVDDHI